MMRVKPSGQRAERRKDQLGWRGDEAAPRNASPFQVHPVFWMEVAAKLRPNFVAAGFMAEHDSRNHKLVLEPAAAMVGKAWIVIANDPNPFEPVSETA